MDKEELLDFYEVNKDYVIKLRFYECENAITLEDLCKLIKIINEKPE